MSPNQPRRPRGPFSSLAFLASLACVAPALLGCSSDGSAPAAQAQDPGGATYYRDIKPIIDAKCANCHDAGGIAPFTLTSYDDVLAMKDAVRFAVSERTMPPWMPAEGCADYQGNRSLSEEQITAITAWVDAGAQAGDPADEPPKAEEGSGIELSRVDLTLPMPEAYTPQIQPDDYRCFLLDWPEQETTYVTGVGLRAGVPEMLHHMIAFLATPDTVADYEALDAAEPGPGYTCYGGPGGDLSSQGRAGWIGTWVPGVEGMDFPAGTGIEVPPGSKVILQLHYNTSFADPSPDLTELLLKIDPVVEKKAAIMPYTDISWVAFGQMPIPAHGTDVSHETSKDPTGFASLLTGGTMPDDTPLTLYTAGLHMHTRGKHAETRIERADGTSECLLDIPAWDFHWQGQYVFETPRHISPGDRIHLGCTWDNPTDQEINWGEGTGDEMCLSAFYVTAE